MEDTLEWKTTLDELIYHQVLPPLEVFKLQLSQVSSSSHRLVNKQLVASSYLVRS